MEIKIGRNLMRHSLKWKPRDLTEQIIAKTRKNVCDVDVQKLSLANEGLKTISFYQLGFVKAFLADEYAKCGLFFVIPTAQTKSQSIL